MEGSCCLGVLYSKETSVVAEESASNYRKARLTVPWGGGRIARDCRTGSNNHTSRPIHLLMSERNKLSVNFIKGAASLFAVGVLLGAGDLSQADRRFVMKALDGGMAEVQIGKLAKERGSSDKVKEIGRTLIEDYSKLNERLKGIAAGKGLRVPVDPDAKQMQTGRLSTLTGEDFDREFLRRQLRYHEEDLREFQQAAQKSEAPDVKSFASDMLPTLRKRLDAIRGAAQGMGVQ